MGSLWPEIGCASLHLRAVCFVLPVKCLVKTKNPRLLAQVFCDWKHAAERITEHENSDLHRQAMVTYVHQALDRGTVDLELKKLFDDKCAYWRQVLHWVVAVTRHLTERRLSLRGHTSVFGDVRNCNYLGSMELITQFDPFLKAHIERYGNAGKGNPS